MKIRIMSFNTQHCKDYNTKKINYDNIINLINKYKVDIIGLNEIYNIPNQTKKIAKNIGYNYCFGKSSNMILPYGNSILSRYKIIDNKVINIKYNNSFKYVENRSILKTKIIINDKTLNIYVTHFGLDDNEKDNEINTLINNIDKDNSIVLGDFNMTNIKINNFNHISDNLPTYPSINPKYKLDYIFTSKNIKVISCKTLDEVISDHRPIIIDIDI